MAPSRPKRLARPKVMALIDLCQRLQFLRTQIDHLQILLNPRWLDALHQHSRFWAVGLQTDEDVSGVHAVSVCNARDGGVGEEG